MGVVNKRVIASATTSSDAWARWLHELPAPPVALDEMLAGHQRLVVLAPHPDDEVLACGGLLHLHMSRGGRCLIVAASDGEASHGPSTTEERQHLAATRSSERQQGLAHLGVPSASIWRLGLPDGALASRAALLEALLHRVLDSEDVLVSTWVLDGHPDHDVCGHVAQRAAARAGARFISAPVWMWHWSFPGDPRVPWHVLRGLALPANAAHRKQLALQAHQSQLTTRARETGAVLDGAILQRSNWPEEYYFV